MPAKPRSVVRRRVGPWGVALVIALACCGGASTGALGAEVPDEPPKPLSQFSEEQLLQQLTTVRALPNITRKQTQSLLRAYQGAFEFNQGSYADATILVREFPFLTSLPVRSGAASRIHPQSAVTLGRLSVKLHAYLDLLTAQGLLGLRPDFGRLQEWLRNETRGQKAEWLRPEAVPALVQILMDGDTPLRLLLVAVLADIEGQAATAALAQRAVFDVCPDVRGAAVRALQGRRADTARPVLLRALRYPWPAVADHAADALVALKDREAVPSLIALLRLPDPNAPFPVGENRYRVAELVRLNHSTSCLYCHPPGSPTDPVVRFDANVSQQATPRTGGCGGGGRYQGGGSSASLASGGGSRGRATPIVPVFMRADVTYLRQDFSQKLSVNLRQPAGASARYDFLVSVRAASTPEVRRLTTLQDEPPQYPQRDAVLFALRGLTGQDAGTTAEAWLERFPKAEFELEVARLSANLLSAPTDRKAQRLRELREGDGAAHTEALARAVSQLSGPLQKQARAALTERLTRLSAAELRDKFQQESAEVRRAAAAAGKGHRELIPDLIRLLYDADLAVVQAAHGSLKELTGKDFGPLPRASADDRVVAAIGWEKWWTAQADQQPPKE